MKSISEAFHAIDPTVRLLVGLLVFFTVVLLYCEHVFTADQVLFTVFSGVFNNCAGALFMRVKPAKSTEDVPPGTTQATLQATVTEAPPEKVA